MNKVDINCLLVLVMGAVLLPLPRINRTHYLADAEGIQLKKSHVLTLARFPYFATFPSGGGGGWCDPPLAFGN